ncbi:hypothetical protein GCM10023189_58850 [Nibrella saemangeumensis]|uniref:histidine kinase n=2 Tax=Nibrella saemangeumensis TaxID=1084526 RepID=A0ABP8NSY4_9BACT
MNGLLNQAPFGALIFTATDSSGTLDDYKLTYANQTAVWLLGRPANSLPGLALADLLPSTIELTTANLLRSQYVGQPVHFVWLNQAGQGQQTRWLEASFRELDHGIAMYLRDVTDEHPEAVGKRTEVELLRAVINNSLNGLMHCEAIRNDEGTIIDFRVNIHNQSMTGLTGVPGSTARVNTFTGLDPFVISSGLMDGYSRVAVTGEPLRVSYYYEPIDRWLDVSAARLDDGIVVSLVDITMARQAVREKQQNAEWLARLYNSSINGIVILQAVRDEQGQIVDLVYQRVNRVAERILGYPSGYMNGRKILEIFPAVKTTGVFDQYVHTIETGEARRVELHYPFDGLEIWFDLSFQKLEDGIVISFLDITPIKKASIRLEEQAQLLNGILDGSLSAILWLTAIRSETGEVEDFRIETVNQAASQLLKTPLEGLVQQRMLPLFPGAMSTGLFDRFSRVLASGQPERFEQVYQQDGQNGWYDASVTKLNDGVVLTFQEITDKKLAQLQLEESVQQLKRSNENLEQFAYVASHDLKEPLRKITAFGDVLQSQFGHQLGSQGQDLIRRMQQAADRMNTLIRDLLSYSRLATKARNRERVDLQTVVTDVLTDLEQVIREKDADIQVAELPTVVGDGSQLGQLFQNLLSNALKFVADGTPPRIRIGCEAVAGQRIPAFVALAPKEQYWKITISDNGIGFDPKYADRIFEVFQRLHGRGQYEGTGVGLAISRKVVENHRGAITVDSQPGVGTTFYVYLPQA